MSAFPSLLRRTLLAAALTLAAGAAQAQDPPKLPRIAVTTPKGVIIIELRQDKAPITVANILRYVDQKRYDGAEFYRASREPGSPQYGMIQGGLNDNPAKKLMPIAHESTAKTGLSHKDGAVSLARWAPGTATSEFFIMVGDQTYLDADPTAAGDNAGFAVFGQVVEGMEVVKAILASPTSPTAGGPAMKGQMLLQPVPIRTVRRAG